MANPPNIINPHTGLPVDFSSAEEAFDPRDPRQQNRLAQYLAALNMQGAAPRTGRDIAMGAGDSPDLSQLDGYSFGQGRQDYNVTDYVIGPDGTPVLQETYEDVGPSLRKGDYADIAQILAAAATAGAGGLSGLGSTITGGALSGGAAAAAGGAAVGGITNGIRTGTVQGALKGAATGGITGYAGSALSDAASQYFGGGLPIDPAATAGDYTNQMDLASDAFSSGVNPSAFAGNYVNQMDGASDAFRPPAPSSGIQTDAFGNDLQNPAPQDIQRIEVQGTKLPADPALPDYEYKIPPIPPVDIPDVQVKPDSGFKVPDALLDPRVIAPIVAGGLTKLNDPGPPPTPSDQSGSKTRDEIISRLENDLYGPGAGKADYSKVPTLQTTAGDPNQYFQQAADALYSKNTRYLDVQTGDQRKALEARLSEQGFVPGTPGYDKAMRTFQDTTNRAYGDARDSSVLSGVTAGQNIFSNNLANANLNNNASQTAFQQAYQQRAQPFNEYATLRTGQQIDNQATQQAATDRYNADVNSKNATNQIVGQVAGGLVSTYTNPIKKGP